MTTIIVSTIRELLSGGHIPLTIIKDVLYEFGSSIEEYQLRIKYSKPSIGYRVCFKCRLNKPFRQFSKIDLKKGPGKSVCCSCVKKIFLHNN
jgi:hypothetical protein